MQWSNPRPWHHQFLNVWIKEPPINTIWLFKAAIYFWLLVNTLFLWPIAHEIWGAESYIIPIEYPRTAFSKLYFILANPNYADYYPWVMGVQVISILGWFTGRWRRVFSVLIYVSTALLFSVADAYTTGGHYLVVLFAFYFVFMSEKTGGPVQNALSNLFLFACKVQLAIVYLFAGLYKIHGEHWLAGDAVYLVLNIREFSHPWVREWLLPHPVLLKMASWIGLGYQLLFPFFIWIESLKWRLLFVGIGFHLFIALTVGLPDFGFLMILSYAMFVSDQRVLNCRLKMRRLINSSSDR